MIHVITVVKIIIISLLLFSVPAICQDDITSIFNIMPRIRNVEISHFIFKLYEYSINDPGSHWNGLKICWIKIPKELVNIKIKDLRDHGNINMIYENSCTGEEIVIVSGGFWDDRYKPEGLLISEGNILLGLAPWKSGGILFQTKSELKILSIRLFDCSYNTEIINAIQSKPFIVENSINGIKFDDYTCYNRVGIGFTNDDQLIICGVFNKNRKALSLFQFGKLMAIKKKGEGPDGKIILNMVGGFAAHIYIPSLDLHFGIPEKYYVANTVNIYLKK